MQRLIRTIWNPAVWLLFSLCAAWPVAAAFADTGRKAASAPPEAVPLDELRQQIDQSIQLQKTEIDRFAELLRQRRGMEGSRRSVLNSYRIQLSTYGNLLSIPDAPIKALEDAWTDIRTATDALTKHLENLEEQARDIENALAVTRSQVETHTVRVADLKQGHRDATALLARLQELLKLLSTKQDVLTTLDALYAEAIAQNRELVQSFAELSDQFEAHVRDRSSRDLFERRPEAIFLSDLSALPGEIRRLGSEIRSYGSMAFWKKELSGLWRSVGYFLFSVAALFFGALFLLVRLKRMLTLMAAHPFFAENRSHRMALALLRRSVLLAGVTLFFYLTTFSDVLLLSTPSLLVVAHLFLVWLLTRWGLDSLALADRSPVIQKMGGRLATLLLLIRYAATAYIVLSWLMGGTGILLLCVRIGFEVGLLVWLIGFWRAAARRQVVFHRGARTVLMAIGYVVAGGAILLELTGYELLAAHWGFSWARTAAVALWWTLFFGMLMEWDRWYQEQRRESGSDIQTVSPFPWLLIRLGQVLWIVSLGIVLILAWGGEQTVLVQVFRALAHPMVVGSMSFSIAGLLYAVLVLLATQAIARLWRHFFQVRFLTQSGMDIGLQESVTTLSVYIIWMFGILVALHVFGLNTASLAVAFGALGIGLGFGLQNIFSNFISGIILLFERPIQVGDDVEVNGVWATVRKINVRATVVQTYDNASLIIPNSDFISSQVTNWSFKDKRLRRNIYVGVAYGSDVGLVRDTMLEIAGSVAGVLKKPQPDVLFHDFGDSALIFRLRYWTLIDTMLTADSAVRFEIDRLFRERNIEIAFPQRDIHIRSTVTASDTTLTSAERPASTD